MTQTDIDQRVVADFRAALEITDPATAVKIARELVSNPSARTELQQSVLALVVICRMFGYPEDHTCVTSIRNVAELISLLSVTTQLAEEDQ